MNLFGFAEIPLPLQLLILALTIGATTTLLFYTLAKSKALADFLEAVSHERLGTQDKLQSPDQRLAEKTQVGRQINTAFWLPKSEWDRL